MLVYSRQDDASLDNVSPDTCDWNIPESSSQRFGEDGSTRYHATLNGWRSLAPLNDQILSTSILNREVMMIDNELRLCY